MVKKARASIVEGLEMPWREMYLEEFGVPRLTVTITVPMTGE
jgi:hypothetical protein